MEAYTVEGVDKHASREIAELADGCNTPKPVRHQTQILLQRISAEAPDLAGWIARIMQNNPPLRMALEDFFFRIEEYSPENYAHVIHTTDMTARIAEALVKAPPSAQYRLTPYQGAVLVVATMLHDYGKLYVPQDILHYSGQLPPDLSHIMRRHVVYSTMVVDSLHLPEPLHSDIRRIVATHHEKLNGTGYPHHLHQDALPPITRILTIVDRMEAMTGRRGYREPVPLNKAIEMLEKEAHDGLIDETLFAHCLPVMEEYLRNHSGYPVAFMRHVGDRSNASLSGIRL